MTQPFTSASEREALLPTGWVLSGGSEAGKLSSSSSPSNFSSLFSTLAFGRLRGPSVSPPRLVWALLIENLLSNGVRRSNRQDIGSDARVTGSKGELQDEQKLTRLSRNHTHFYHRRSGLLEALPVVLR